MSMRTIATVWTAARWCESLSDMVPQGVVELPVPHRASE